MERWIIQAGELQNVHLTMRFILILLCTLSAFGAVRYVDPVLGNNANAGTEALPWKDIRYATRTGPNKLAAGDTLKLRGGVYDRGGLYDAVDLGGAIVGNSGTPGNPITIEAYTTGEGAIEVVWLVNIDTPYRPFLIRDRSDWIIRNINFSNNFACMLLENVTNFYIDGCQFAHMNTNTGKYAWGAVSFEGNSQFNTITNCTFHHWGHVSTNTSPTSAGEDIGSGLVIGNETTDVHTWHNLVVDCKFWNNGHDHIQLSSGYNVFRRLYLHQEPHFRTNEYSHTISLNAEENPYGAYGNRQTKPGDAGTTQIDMRNVFEDIIFAYTGPPPDDGGAFGIEMGTSRSIYRRSVVAFSLAAGILFNTSGTTSKANSNYVYSMTIYANGLSHIYGGTVMQSFSGGVGMSNFEWETRRRDNRLVNNIVWGNYPTNVTADVRARQSYRTNWTGDVIDGSLAYPKFVDTNGFTHPTNSDFFRLTGAPNFRLKSDSPCIDAATWLTTVTSATGSGTSFTVVDAGYFSDGNLIVEGDTIQLQGATNRSVISVVDVENNVITFSPSLTWTNGQGLALAYSGSAPDFGAYEYDGTTPPTTPANPAAAGGIRSANITWTASAGGPTGYVVLVSVDGQNFTEVVTTASTSYTHATAPGAKTYRIIAQNQYGESGAASATCTVTGDVPASNFGRSPAPTRRR